MYHRFGYGSNSLFVTPDNFEKQMEYLKKGSYKVISLDELVKGIENKRRFRRKTLVITIDDGYKDIFTYAYPILKRYEFPATIFVIANHIDNREDFLTREEIKEMLGHNISIGAHTKNEFYLPEIEKEGILWDEIVNCKFLIESKIGSRIDFFCYPIGGFTEEIKEIVQKGGYKAACTTNRGFSKFNKDLYELKRVKITNSDMNRPLHFWAKLTGYYNLLRSKKSGH